MGWSSGGGAGLTIAQIATQALGSASLTGNTVTTSQPLLDLAQTYNAGGVTFAGLRFNVTDTASANGSTALDIQIGGTSQLRVAKLGSGAWYLDPFNGAANNQMVKLSSSVFIGSDTAQVYFFDTGYGASLFSVNNGTTVAVRNDFSYAWCSSTSAGGATDTAISRAAPKLVKFADGVGGNGAIAAQTKAGAFVAADLPVSGWIVGRDTTNSTTKLYYNNAGTLMVAALA